MFLLVPRYNCREPPPILRSNIWTWGKPARKRRAWNTGARVSMSAGAAAPLDALDDGCVFHLLTFLGAAELEGTTSPSCRRLRELSSHDVLSSAFRASFKARCPDADPEDGHKGCGWRTLLMRARRRHARRAARTTPRVLGENEGYDLPAEAFERVLGGYLDCGSGEATRVLAPDETDPAGSAVSGVPVRVLRAPPQWRAARACWRRCQRDRALQRSLGMEVGPVPASWRRSSLSSHSARRTSRGQVPGLSVRPLVPGFRPSRPDSAASSPPPI